MATREKCSRIRSKMWFVMLKKCFIEKHFIVHLLQTSVINDQRKRQVHWITHTIHLLEFFFHFCSSMKVSECWCHFMLNKNFLTHQSRNFWPSWRFPLGIFISLWMKTALQKKEFSPFFLYAHFSFSTLDVIEQNFNLCFMHAWNRWIFIFENEQINSLWALRDFRRTVAVRGCDPRSHIDVINQRI